MAARMRAADTLAQEGAQAGTLGATRRGARLASPAVVALMRHRTARLGGLALGLLGLTLLLALLSYDARDPSFDTATMRHATSLGGPVGAALADLLLQGLASQARCPALPCWRGPGGSPRIAGRQRVRAAGRDAWPPCRSRRRRWRVFHCREGWPGRPRPDLAARSGHNSATWPWTQGGMGWDRSASRWFGCSV